MKPLALGGLRNVRDFDSRSGSNLDLDLDSRSRIECNSVVCENVRTTFGLHLNEEVSRAKLSLMTHYA